MTAVAGEDFSPDFVALTFTPLGPVCATFSISADEELEGEEEFSLEFTTAIPQRVVRSALGVTIVIQGTF